MYTILKQNNGSLSFPPNTLDGEYSFFSGTIVLQRKPFFILYKIFSKTKDMFSNNQQNLELTEGFKRIDINNLNDNWLTQSYGNIILEREQLDSIIITITFDFSNTTEWAYSINGNQAIICKGSSKIGYKTIDYDEIYGCSDNIIQDSSSNIFENGRIKKIQNIFSHNIIEESNIIQLNFFDIKIKVNNGFTLNFYNENGSKIKIEKFIGSIYIDYYNK